MNTDWLTDIAIAIVLAVLILAVLVATRRTRLDRQLEQQTDDIEDAREDARELARADDRTRRQKALAAWGASIRSEGPVPPVIPEPTENWRADMRRRLGEQDSAAARWDEPMPEPPPEVADPGAMPAPLPEPKIEVQHGLTPENPDAPKLQIEPDDRPLPDAPTGTDDTRKLDPRPIDADRLPEPFIPYRERVFPRPGVPLLIYPDALTDTSTDPTQTGPQSDLTNDETSPPGFVTHEPVTGVEPTTPVEDHAPVTLVDPPTRVEGPAPVPPPTPPVVEILPVFRPLPPGFVAQAERVRGNRVKRVRGRIVSDHAPPPEADTPKSEDPA